jgi:hypothetical protein
VKGVDPDKFMAYCRLFSSSFSIQEVQLFLPVKTCSLSHEEKVRRAVALWAMKVASAGFSYQSSDEISTYVS